MSSPFRVTQQRRIFLPTGDRQLEVCEFYYRVGQLADEVNEIVRAGIDSFRRSDATLARSEGPNKADHRPSIGA